MLRWFLLGSLGLGATSCSTERPDFAPQSGASSNSSDVGESSSGDAADAAASSARGSSGASTGVASSIGSGVNPATNDDSSPSDGSSDDDTTNEPGAGDDTTEPNRTDDTTAEPDTTNEPDTSDDTTAEPSTSDGDPSESTNTSDTETCDDKCQSGAAQCSNGQLKRCEANSDGCLDWGTPTACEPAKCATETACVVCDDKCSSGGATSCDDGDLRTCEADDNGCLDWGASSSCDTGACASSTVCLVCDNKCTSGTYSCSGSQLSSCEEDANGCLDYAPEAMCGGDTPTCSANAGRCECQSNAAPKCTNSTTASQCSNGAWSDSECSGNTPVCLDGLGCQACTEHSHCPNSACHLAGSKKGSCFAANTVTNVNSAATLLNAVNATTDGGEFVIKLGVGTYTMTSELVPKGETAILGQSGVVVVDNIPPPGDGRAAFLYGSGTTYLAKFELRNTSGGHSGVSPYTGAVMWLDDMKINGEGTGITANGECHLRRTSIYGGGSGALAYYSGSLFIENSMIGPSTASSSTGIGAWSGGVLDVRYSTIVGFSWGVGCTIGSSSGRISNSIIASNVGGYSIADENADCSEAFSLVTNAIDQTGYGTKIAVYSSNWFVGASSGNLRLSNAGKVAIPAIAVRASGDPSVDIDGATRPDNLGFPGADEP